MKRYVNRLAADSDGPDDYTKVVPEIDAFLEQIFKVCKQHNMTISHEDCHGGFEIEDYDKQNIAWLNDASDAREGPK